MLFDICLQKLYVMLQFKSSFVSLETEGNYG